MKKKKQLKFRNKIVFVDGIKFHSKKEAQRYPELLMLERAGYIQDLQLQVKFKVCPKVQGLKGSRDRYYIADFVYIRDGRKIIEDVKAPPTRKEALYRLKKQLVQVHYPEYDFIET